MRVRHGGGVQAGRDQATLMTITFSAERARATACGVTRPSPASAKILISSAPSNGTSNQRLLRSVNAAWARGKAGSTWPGPAGTPLASSGKEASRLPLYEATKAARRVASQLT